MKQILLFVCVIFFTGVICAQTPFPPHTTIFDDSEVARIDIVIHSDSLEALLAEGNEWSDHEYPAIFTYTSSGIQQTIYNVGLRLRGNTSRYASKKSFKISFNTFQSGGNFYGVEKMNLNGEHNDPTIMRAKLAWTFFNDFQCFASRSNHVELYINNEYKGLYVNVEHIDEEFVQLRFGNKSGNLYKCLWPADMVYINNNPDSYKFMTGDRRAYDLKTNTEEDDYSDLANLIDIVNNSPINSFPSTLENVFDVNNFLKYLAAETVTGHWDGYSYNKNNFYLYNNPETGKFVFIPYDVDNTFGIDWMGINWQNRDVYNWAFENENRPLTKRILQNQTYKDRYTFYLKQLVTYIFDIENLIDEIELRKEMIDPYAFADLYRTYDYGWSIENYNNSYYNALGGHVTSGLIPYLENRFLSTLQQIYNVDITPILISPKNSQPYLNQDIEFQITVEDETLNNAAKFYYRISGSSDYNILNMNDIGSQNELMRHSRNYSANIGQFSEPQTIEYYFTATDSTGKTGRTPYEGFYTLQINDVSVVPLRINELMASNVSTIADEFGDFDDWIELYNMGSETINLNNIYLTDNLSNPNKWKLPNMDLNAGDFLLLWADDEQAQGIWHTNFKLSATGEEIGLFEEVDGNFYVIDQIVYGAQNADISLGRQTDGVGDYITFVNSTPNYSNTWSNINSFENKESFVIYPNPVKDDFFYLKVSETVAIQSIEIYNTSGILLQSENFQTITDNNLYYIQLKNNYHAGLYFVKVQYFNNITSEISFQTIKFVK